MGQCKMSNCRCECSTNRIACQCGSQNTLIMEDQVREFKRRNEVSQLKRSNRFLNKSGTPKKSDSRDSSDSLNKTKHSTKKQTSKTNFSIEKYLMSEECNLQTENSQQNPKHILLRSMTFNFKNSYFLENDIFKEPKEYAKQESPYFVSRYAGTLDQIASIKEQYKQSQTVPENNQLQQEKEKQNSSNLQQPSDSYNHSISIAGYTEKLTKISPPPSDLLRGSASDNQIRDNKTKDNKIKGSLQIQQQSQQHRSKTADLSDDQKSLMTPTKGVLKTGQQSSHDSFRTQQQERRKVRFHLPNSHYVKERQKEQQLFFA